MKKKGRVNKRLCIFFASLLAIVICTGLTLSYFYDNDAIRDHFFAADNDSIKVQLIEPRWIRADQGLDSLPGDQIPADPTIVNEEDPVYMRLAITLTDKETGKVITGDRAELIWSMVRYTGRNPDKNPSQGSYTWAELEERFPNRINETVFCYDEARSEPEHGKYYFNYIYEDGILDTGAAAVLYDYVLVPSDWGTAELGIAGRFVIRMKGEAIHAEGAAYEGIETKEQAFEAIHQRMAEK